MEVTVYEEKKLKYNKTELSEFSENRKSYYEDEIKYLNEEQILKFLNGISNTFHQMVFSFLFETGARVSEALAVKLIDIDFKNNTVKLITLKRRNKNIVRVLTLSDSLINKILIFEKSKDLKKSDYVFSKKSGNKAISVQAVNSAIKKHFVATLEPEYFEMAHPHTLRHSRAIQLLNSGVNIMQVKAILGHSNLMNTMVYLKYSDKDIQNSIRKSNISLGIY